MLRQFPADTTTWQPANNGPGPRHWFVYRRLSGKPMQIAEDRRGRRRRFASIDSAWIAADELNGG